MGSDGVGDRVGISVMVALRVRLPVGDHDRDGVLVRLVVELELGVPVFDAVPKVTGNCVLDIVLSEELDTDCVAVRSSKLLEVVGGVGVCVAVSEILDS